MVKCGLAIPSFHCTVKIKIQSEEAAYIQSEPLNLTCSEIIQRENIESPNTETSAALWDMMQCFMHTHKDLRLKLSGHTLKGSGHILVVSGDC